jgi:hypothetical protein
VERRIPGQIDSRRLVPPTHAKEIIVSEALKCIVVCTSGTSDSSAVEAVALAKATESGARVIFYDVSHDGQMTDSRPNFWAGEGEEELYNRPLDPVAIDKLGYHELAVHVQRARDAGVDAFGWLPNDPGGKGLAAYVQREQADLVLMPAGTETTAKYVDDLRKLQGTEGSTGAVNISLVDADRTVVPLR